jgi:hypothetical protein
MDPACQREYSALAASDPPLKPWLEVHVDCVGLWTFTVAGKDHCFSALTCIDPASVLLEVLLTANTTATHIVCLYEQCWLARYPRTQYIVHDNGTEFIGLPFQQMLQSQGIQVKHISAYTPTANAYIERTHQALANALQVMLILWLPTKDNQVDPFKQDMCAATMYASQLSAHQSLSSLTASAIAFQQPTLIDTPIITNWVSIASNCLRLIDKTVKLQNKRCCDYDYQPGHQVLVYKVGILCKTVARCDGPFHVDKVHTNGTVTICRTKFVTEQLSIHWSKPYRTDPSVGGE